MQWSASTCRCAACAPWGHHLPGAHTLQHPHLPAANDCANAPAEQPVSASLFTERMPCVQSYSGGKDIWGLHDASGMAQRPEEAEKGFSKPIFDDGLLEVIGLKSGWHTFTVLGQFSERIHGERLAQAHEIVAEFIDAHSGGACAINVCRQHASPKRPCMRSGLASSVDSAMPHAQSRPFKLAQHA